MSQFAGVWKLESSDNFDAYMKEVGVSWAVRKMAESTKPTLTITVKDKHFAMTQKSAVSTSTTEFDLDVEFDEKTPDGRQCKSTFTLRDDGKLVQVQKAKVDSNFLRWVEGDYLITECTANGVKSVRKYKRQ